MSEARRRPIPHARETPPVDEEMETPLDDDSIPIVLLPDDIDLDALPEQDAAPAPSSVPILVPVPVPVPTPSPPLPPPRPPSPRTPTGTARIVRKAPLVSLAQIEAEIRQEIKVDQEGASGLFTMPFVCRAIALGALALLVLLLLIGRDYYRLPVAMRGTHHLHAALRPSGLVGLPLGGLGLLLMASSLLYLVRKHLRRGERLGSLPGWMGFHILMGLVGPAVALFHAAFAPQSVLGLVALGSALLVVASGILGRWVAVRFPRSLNGREFHFEEVRGRLAVYRKKLVEHGVNPSLLRVDPPRVPRRPPWVLVSAVRILHGDWESRREFQRLKEVLAGPDRLPAEMAPILLLIRRLCRERQWLVRYGEFRRVMSTWRFLHRWLAVLLFTAVAFHVLVAVRFGGLWILGGR